MDPLQFNDDDNLNFDKSGIQLRLNRLIEKQTKRYESLISSGNHGDAQRLLQIIWQLKQLRLPGVEDVSMEQSLPPGKLAPILEPYLKDRLNDSQLSLLFEKPVDSSVPPLIESMEPSMPELLKTKTPIINSAPTQILSPAPASFPSIPAPVMPPLSQGTTPPPNIVQTKDALTPEHKPVPEPEQTPQKLSSPSSSFDDISSGEFDIATKVHFQPPMQKISASLEPNKDVPDFEDESSKYDDPDAFAPLRGLTTGHVPVVKKEDLINYRKEVRNTIAWEEDEIAPVGAVKKAKSYSSENIKIKDAQTLVDSADEESLDLLQDEVDFAPKSVTNKTLIFVAGSAAVMIIGGLVIFAFVSMSSPKFEDLEKMGRQSDKSPFEMEQLYLKAVKVNPSDPRAWSGLSYWQSRQGQIMPALESQSKAIKLAPKDAKQWFALAQLLKTCSNYKESLRAANEAVALEPQNSQYLSLQEQVQDYNP